MKCPHCGQEHPDNTKFCPETGKKIELVQNNSSELVACQNPACEDFGKKILPADSKFCPSCGKPITVAGDNCLVASYSDENNVEHYLNDVNEWDKENIIVFTFGNWSYDIKQNLYLNQDGKNINLGKYEMARPIFSFLFAQKNYDENTPFEIYSPEGHRLSASDNYGDICGILKNGIFLCKLSRNKYGFVNIKDNVVLYTIDGDPTYYRYPAMSIEYNTALWIDGSRDDFHIYFYNSIENNVNQLDYYCDFVKDKYSHKPTSQISVINDEYFLINESNVSSEKREFYVVNKFGDRIHSFPEGSYPRARKGIVYCYKNGIFNGNTGLILNSDYSADFCINDCLVAGKHVGPKEWSRNYGVVDILTDNILLDFNEHSSNYPVIDNKEQVRYILFFGYGEKPCLLYDTIDRKKIALTSVGSELLSFDRYNGFLNLRTFDHWSDCYDDQRPQDITNYSFVYDSNWNLVFGDTWGKYIGVYGGYEEGKLYCMQKDGQFGYIKEGVYYKIKQFDYIEPYQFVPLYLLDRFLIYYKNGIALIDKDGNLIKELDPKFFDIRIESDEDIFSVGNNYISYRKVLIGNQEDKSDYSDHNYLTNLKTGYQFENSGLFNHFKLEGSQSIREYFSNVYKF